MRTYLTIDIINVAFLNSYGSLARSWGILKIGSMMIKLLPQETYPITVTQPVRTNIF